MTINAAAQWKHPHNLKDQSGQKDGEYLSAWILDLKNVLLHSLKFNLT